MKKSHALALVFSGIGVWIVGLALIYGIFQITKAINSQPEPPVNAIIFENIPYCNCDISNGLAWNMVAILVSIGAVFVTVGIAKFNLVTRRQ